MKKWIIEVMNCEGKRFYCIACKSPVIEGDNFYFHSDQELAATFPTSQHAALAYYEMTPSRISLAKSVTIRSITT